MLMFCSVVISGDLSNTVSAVYNFDFDSAENLEIMNGYDIFIKDDSLYAIVWKSTGIIDVGYDSRLLIKKKGSEEWTIVDIPGKAYYLGAAYNNEICSTIQDRKNNIWHISFYDLAGRKLREYEHKYKVFSREYIHYEPVPLCYDDGSLIFYTIYKYETRNIVSKTFLNMILLGYGSAKGFSEYVEIVPDLINKESKRRSFSYARVTDSSGLRKAFPLNKDIPLFDSMKKRDLTAGNYKITAYELEDKDSNYYFNNNKLIKASDKMEIVDINNGNRVVLPMPPAMDNIFVFDFDKFKFDGFARRGSDAWAESDDVILAIRVREHLTAKIIIYFYDSKKKQWSMNTLIDSNENYRHLTMYKKDESLYMGLWGNSQKFRIIKYKVQ